MFFRKKDPVCGVGVSKKTKYTYRFNQRTYYFDCSACLETFKSNPLRFAGSRKKQGFLSWLAKGKGSVPKSCHDNKNK